MKPDGRASQAPEELRRLWNSETEEGEGILDRPPIPGMVVGHATAGG